MTPNPAARPAGSTDAALSDLQQSLGAKVVVTEAVREQHGIDEGWHVGHAPDAVVFATSLDDVVTTVRVCHAHHTPLIPFGAGTSLEGQIAALRGGVSLDLSGLDRIIEVNVGDLDCRVEAGVHRVALNDRLQRDGLFFPIDPGADATIGGMVATRASGTNAVRYGTMRDSVLGLTAVLADGSIARTGTRARKSSAGYDLTRLLVGSEGTLGVMTDVTLRLHGIPEVIGGAVCGFATLRGAVDTVIQVIQLGIPIARVEFLDAAQVAACNAYSDLDLPERPLLLMEFHGSPSAVDDQSAAVRELASANGGADWQWSTDTETRNALWKARHDAYYAALALRPGCRGIPTDVCVPISRLADCIDQTRDDLETTGLTATIVGHVGDGNFHTLPLFDPDDQAEREAVEAFHDRLVHRALEMGGTCTGEHGIGYGKLAFMSQEHDVASLAAMRAIKSALDPRGILNPGKVVPA